MATAIDPPHDSTWDNTCFSCHIIHNYLGPSLTKEESINNLCRSCHYDVGPATDVTTHQELNCTACHNPHTQDQNNIYGSTYGKLIRTEVESPFDNAVRNVIFLGPTDSNSFADGDGVYDGICEVCHINTHYHTYNGTYDNGVDPEPVPVLEHHSGEDCTTSGCHEHANGLGSSGGHSIHANDSRGPNIGCNGCHEPYNPPYLKSGTDANGDGKYDLSETNVCDSCHSPGGAYDGINDPFIGAKPNWADGVYDNSDLKPGKETWCVGCHDTGTSTVNGVAAPPVAGDDSTWGFYATGHGRNALVSCTGCHDTTATHTDGLTRTYSFHSIHYEPRVPFDEFGDPIEDGLPPEFPESGVFYATAYRLSYVGGEVPLMIPANYGITFKYDAGLMRDTAFRLCFSCHDASAIFDDTPGNGIDSNFKASLPNPPRDHSYAWGSGADVNEHVSHLLNYIGPFADSDWDLTTDGPGGTNGHDTLTGCFSCHNVHGAAGAAGSTNEAMVRDGSLIGRTGYGFSYVIEDASSGGYPWVTSTGATQSNSVGAIFRNNTANMCGGSMCHGSPEPPPASSYDATGSSWGTYIEYYRPYGDY